MKIGLSLETTLKLRNTWHSAINHEWYDFLQGHTIVPLVCYGQYNLQDLDLVILCGGNDMPHIKTWRDNSYPKRDQFESQLLQDCIETKTPLIGICRGSHFINYHLGGSIELMDEPYDNVKTTLNWGSEQVEVTCHHTVYNASLAPGLVPFAVDQVGIIEGFQHDQLPIVGLGWHPERAVNAHTRPAVIEIIKNLMISYK